MHIYAGEKSVEDKEKRKKQDLINIAKEIFRDKNKFSYSELVDLLMATMDIKERTAKNYIKYMKEYKIIKQDYSAFYLLNPI